MIVARPDYPIHTTYMTGITDSIRSNCILITHFGSDISRRSGSDRSMDLNHYEASFVKFGGFSGLSGRSRRRGRPLYRVLCSSSRLVERLGGCNGNCAQAQLRESHLKRCRKLDDACGAGGAAAGAAAALAGLPRTGQTQTRAWARMVSTSPTAKVWFARRP